MGKHCSNVSLFHSHNTVILKIMATESQCYLLEEMWSGVQLGNILFQNAIGRIIYFFVNLIQFILFWTDCRLPGKTPLGLP